MIRGLSERVRRVAAAMLVLASLALLAAPASAQPEGEPRASDSAQPEAADKKDEAREHFQRGLDLLGVEAYPGALAEFLASRALYPTKSATKNAAVCYRQLGRYDEALNMLESLLRDFTEIPDAEKQDVAAEMQALRRLVGFVEIVSGEPGAAVVVDGRPRGRTPLAAPLRLAIGTHAVRVFKEGFLPYVESIEVASGRTRVLDVELRPLTRSGRLKVTEGKGRSAKVFLDNVEVGTTPWQGQVAAGRHTVLLRGEGRLGTQPATATVRLGEITTLSLALEQLSAELRVDPTPVSAEVAIDGVSVGSGVWEGRLRSGSHRVEIGAEGFIKETRTVRLVPDSSEVLSVALDRDPSSPLWASKNPPAVVLEVGGGIVLTPTLGSDAEGDCSGGCSRGLGLGPMLRAGVGYRFSSSIALGVEAGYTRLALSVEDRPTVLSPRGLDDSSGTVDDAFALSGFFAGPFAGIRRGDPWVWGARLGAGVFIGTLSDERSGRFDNQFAGSQYDVSATTAEEVARYLYVAPSGRVGYRISPTFELAVALRATVALAISRPAWPSDRSVLAGACTGAATFPDCLGQAEYQPEDLTGTALFYLGPTVEGRYELR